MHSDHVHWIAKSCSTSCYCEYFFKNLNLIFFPCQLCFPSPSSQVHFWRLHLTQLRVCLTSINTKNIWNRLLGVLLLQNHHFLSPGHRKTKHWLNSFCACPALTHNFQLVGGETEREEVLKYSLGYKTHGSMPATHLMYRKELGLFWEENFRRNQTTVHIPTYKSRQRIFLSSRSTRK